MTIPIVSKTVPTRSANRLRPLAHLASGMLVCAGLVWAPGVMAQQNNELVSLINQYRDSSAKCEGRETVPTGPLAPNEKLSGIDLTAGDWQDEMRVAGYQASAAKFVQLTGPSTAEQAMEMIKGRFCDVLRSEQFAEIGVSRSDNAWQIVLATPLVSEQFKDRQWMDVGQEVVAKVNLARREARSCGDQEFPAAQPLTWDGRLARAALEHSEYMAENGVLTHAGPEGQSVQARVDMVGYEWGALGENVAVGQSTPEQVVAAWLNSPKHCANIMNPEFTEMGAAYETRPQTSIYWTQVFGRER
ncbi:MAG: CAP domain-containing protein [Pseudomonas sp.]|nr:CAP domain-containing protein [Pseudomonas sp.]